MRINGLCFRSREGPFDRPGKETNISGLDGKLFISSLDNDSRIFHSPGLNIFISRWVGNQSINRDFSAKCCNYRYRFGRGKPRLYPRSPRPDEKSISPGKSDPCRSSGQFFRWSNGIPVMSGDVFILSGCSHVWSNGIFVMSGELVMKSG